MNNQLQNLIEGLKILQEHGATEVAPDHDIIYIYATDSFQAFNEESWNGPYDDRRRLEELGFHWDISNNTWAIFT